MKRNYVFKGAEYNIMLPNYLDEFLRNMMFNLHKNGKISLDNPADFYDDRVESNGVEMKAVLSTLYTKLMNDDCRKIVNFDEAGKVEQVNIEIKPAPEKSTEEHTKKTNTGEKPKRGRKKKSE